MQRVLFAATFGFIMGHELDAMTHAEWRLLPLLNLLSDQAGRAVFVAIHVPLIAAVVWLHTRGGWAFHALFGAFCAIHAGLHWAFEAHPFYTFRGVLSEALIWGAGFFGAALALVSARERGRA